MNKDYFIGGDIIDRINGIVGGVQAFRQEAYDSIAVISHEIDSKASYDLVASIQFDSELIRQDVDSLKNDVECLKQILIGIYDKLESMEMLRMDVGADELAGLIMGEK